MRSVRVVAPLALALLCGCNSEFDNPFANTSRTSPPRATAAVIFASNLHGAPGSSRELYAVDLDGTGLTRLTFCATDTQPCDTSAVSPAPDRQRVAVIRRRDADGNSRLDAADGNAMLFIDLARGAEAGLVPATGEVAAIDWAAHGRRAGVRRQGRGQRRGPLSAPTPTARTTATSRPRIDVRERGGRVDPSGTVAVYERVEAAAKPAIFVFVDRTRQVRITTPRRGHGGAAGHALHRGLRRRPHLLARRRLASCSGG